MCNEREMDVSDISGPVFVMAMPIDAEGNGPAEPEETVTTIFEVWDQNNIELCSCVSREIAEHLAAMINGTSFTGVKH
jgi:hypothetical protein